MSMSDSFLRGADGQAELRAEDALEWSVTKGGGVATFEQIRELRWLRKNGIGAMPDRCRLMTDDERGDLRFLYGEMRDAKLIDGLLFADNIPWFAHVTLKGKRESSVACIVSKGVPSVLRLAIAAVRGFLSGCLCLALIWAALHASTLSSIVQTT